jgi:hypothetical protein
MTLRTAASQSLVMAPEMRLQADLVVQSDKDEFQTWYDGHLRDMLDNPRGSFLPSDFSEVLNIARRLGSLWGGNDVPRLQMFVGVAFCFWLLKRRHISCPDPEGTAAYNTTWTFQEGGGRKRLGDFTHGCMERQGDVYVSKMCLEKSLSESLKGILPLKGKWKEAKMKRDFETGIVKDWKTVKKLLQGLV